MTRAQLLKGTFRALTIKLGRAKVPMIVTNHTYDEQGTMYPGKIMSGGSGLKYAASSIFFFSKAKAVNKTTNEHFGAIITVQADKSRLTKEKTRVKTCLNFKTGLNRYYGLLDIALKYDIVTTSGNKIQFPDGRSEYESVVYHKEPEKYFTKEFLDQIDVACQKEFCYGESDAPLVVEPEEDGLD